MKKAGGKNKKSIGRLNVNKLNELDVITGIIISDENPAKERLNLIKKKHNIEENKRSITVRPCNLDYIFQTLDQSDLRVKKSKEFIVSVEGAKGYKCSLCETAFTLDKNLLQLRFCIWTHLYEPNHKINLKGAGNCYEHELNKQCNNLKKAVYKEIIGELKDDVQFFEIGPVDKFLICTLCNCAVSCHLYRLKNHLEDKIHAKNKRLVPKIVASPGAIPITKKLRDSFLDVYSKDNSHQRLALNLPLDLKCEKKYILVGNIPGYLICYICCKHILPTPFYLESHLRGLSHQEKKCKFSEFIDYEESSKTITLPRPLSEIGMNTFISLVNTDNSELKSNVKFIFKDYCDDVYSCNLCNVSFQTYESHLLIEEFKLHFKGDEHKKNVRIEHRVLLKEDNKIFPLFADLPEEIYEDIKFISVLSSQEKTQELLCTLCDHSIDSDLNMIVDHIQSKSHNKKKIRLNTPKDMDCSKEINCSEKMNIVFEKLSKTFHSIIYEKQYFVKDESGLSFICQFCCTSVGNVSDNITGLEKTFTRHILKKTHKENRSRFYKQETEEKNKKTIEELFNKVPDLWKHDRKCIVVSKDHFQLKCKACKEKFPMYIQNLLDHINKYNHRENVLAKLSGQDFS